MLIHSVHGRSGAVLMSLLGLALLPACGSISASVKSASSPFSWSSTSSKSSSSEGGYQDDVRDYTAAHLQTGGNTDDLRRQIGTLAEKHGVTDWERDPSTFQGVGQGLAKAGYNQVQVDAVKNNFAKSPEQAKWIQQGYDEKH